MLFGSGLRKDGPLVTLTFLMVNAWVLIIPLILGIEHTFKFNNKNDIKVRFDVVNVFDEVYELRNGTGVGVAAPSYGPRRGFYGGVTYDF